MSSLTKILSEKDVADETKLANAADIVAVARKAYGNEDTEITVVRVHTCNGELPFDMLDDASKVVILKSEVASLKANAVEFAEQNPGVNLNKKIEELLATNGMFCNIAAGTKFEYI